MVCTPGGHEPRRTARAAGGRRVGLRVLGAIASAAAMTLMSQAASASVPAPEPPTTAVPATTTAEPTTVAVPASTLAPTTTVGPTTTAAPPQATPSEIGRA